MKIHREEQVISWETYELELDEFVLHELNVYITENYDPHFKYLMMGDILDWYCYPGHENYPSSGHCRFNEHITSVYDGNEVVVGNLIDFFFSEYMYNIGPISSYVDERGHVQDRIIE